MERVINRIKARPERGNFVTILEIQEYLDGTHMGSAGTEWVPGMKRYELEGGGFVSKLPDGTFQDVGTGEIYRTR